MIVEPQMDISVIELQEQRESLADVLKIFKEDLGEKKCGHLNTIINMCDSIIEHCMIELNTSSVDDMTEEEIENRYEEIKKTKLSQEGYSL